MEFLPAEKKIELLKRLSAARLIASRDPADEKEARTALEAVDVLVGDCIQLLEILAE